MRIEKILSEFDGLGLEIAVIVPEGNPKGVIQFSHGMAEHKERYYDFMNYLSDHGYVCVIHDHRGTWWKCGKGRGLWLFLYRE